MDDRFLYWPGTRWRWACRLIGHKGVLVTDLDAWVLYCRRCGNELGRGDSPEDLLFEEYDPRLKRRQR